MKCNECENKLDYCCRLTIENQLKKEKRKKRLKPQDVYFAHSTVCGFSAEQQRTQLHKQNWQCGFCGGARQPLVMDKQQATDEHRLVFVCRQCRSIISKVRKYESNQQIFKNFP